MIKQHKNIQYPKKQFRMSEEVYQKLKVDKREGETWNKYFIRLLKKHGK